jgi:hypothetical protein
MTTVLVLGDEDGAAPALADPARVRKSKAQERTWANCRAHGLRDGQTHQMPPKIPSVASIPLDPSGARDREALVVSNRQHRRSSRDLDFWADFSPTPMNPKSRNYGSLVDGRYRRTRIV